MTSPFNGSATLSYESGRIAFSQTTLTMPFPGALVIPGPAGQTPSGAGLAVAQSPFVGLRFPRKGQGDARRFPQLRTMDGSVLEVSGPVIVLVAEDPGLFDEFDLGKILSPGSVLTPQFPETGALTSCRPKHLVLELAAGTQVSDAAPRLVKDGTDLTQIAGFPQGSLSGTLIAFDFAGLEIEADAALATLGNATVTNLPTPTNAVRVQVVDVLGKPLSVEMMATLDAKVGAAGTTALLQVEDGARHLHRLQFPDADRTLKIGEQPISSAAAQGERYLWRGSRVAIWPGHGARQQPLKDKPVFDLNVGVPAGQSKPVFVRLCVFHPSQTMQTAYTGELDDDGRFTKANATDGSPPSGFALAAEADAVEVFNDGESYFADFYAAIEAAVAGDSLYLTNWSSDAHLHLLGTLSRMGLAPVDLDTSEVDADLALIDGNRIVLTAGTDDKHFLVLADRLDRGEGVREGFEYETRRVPPPGVKDKALTRGVVQPGGLYAFSLAGDQGTAFESRIIARWKDPAGGVHETQRTLGTGIAPIAKTAIPVDALGLGITTDDPPSGTVIRKVVLGDIRTAIGAASGPLWLLVVDTTTGRHVVHDLTLTPNGTDVVLGALPDDTSATDTLHAVALNADPGASDALSGLVVSGARQLKYTSDQHVSGAIPLADEELGALLRRAIAEGVTVRALYWDNFLANLKGGEGLETGHANNQEMTALLNIERNGKRGYAIRDRATRAFGSFHQKGIVLVKGSPPGITAWVGGIDLALGRWDTAQHHEADPDRQGGKWWDVQVRMEGPAAIDVLRNFAQRWWAVGAFIKEAQTFPTKFKNCVPVDAPPEIRTDTQSMLTLPTVAQLVLPADAAASVQITRTCPPKSCHSTIAPPAQPPGTLEPQGTIAEGGELGSLAAYLKAIGMARRFVMINDQYFFSPEIALALHEALIRPDGPSFAVLILPKDLSEFELIDPMLFKVREKALHVLMHGGTWTAPSVPSGQLDDSFRFPHCGGVSANAGTQTSPLAGRVAIMRARNRDGGAVYVHGKHMIVDDVWMSIGSANLGYRSTTYDFETNASIVGDLLDFGGSDLVRAQRIELARRMLGLPPAYASLIADPEAMFAQFKALEAKGDLPSHGLHPLGPMCQKLDPAYVKKVGDAAFDGNVDTVSKLGMNDPTIDGIACTIIDPDGRATKEALAPFNFVVTNSAQAYAKVNLTIGCQPLTAGLINGGVDLFAEIRVTEGSGTPRSLHKVPLMLQGSTVVPTPAVGDIWVPISTEEKVGVEARVIDFADAPRGCAASHAYDPNTEIIIAGSLRDLSLTLA